LPVVPRLLADDISPERLATLLSEQGGRMSMFSPEGDLFDMMAGRYSGAVNLGIYLKAHSGDILRVDRVGRPPEFISEPALTIGLAVQPSVIESLASKPEFRGRGLLARFLYSMPESLLGRRESNPATVPGSVQATYRTCLLTLLRLSEQTDENGELVPKILDFDNSARQVLWKFHEWLEPELAPLGSLGY